MVITSTGNAFAIGSELKVTKVVTNGTTAAIKEDGSLWMWGYNLGGEVIKDTSTVNPQNVGSDQIDIIRPIQIMDDVKDVYLNGIQTAALKNDGSLWLWGSLPDEKGEYKTPADIFPPTKFLSDVTEANFSAYLNTAIKTDGSLWIWGYKDGDTYIPSPIRILSNVKCSYVFDDSYGFGFSVFALKKDNSLWYMGTIYDNNNLGLPETKVEKPEKLLDNIKFFDGFSVITTEGDLLELQFNNNGGVNNSLKDNLSTKKILSDVVQCEFEDYGYGDVTRAAIKKDGSLWMWGFNNFLPDRPTRSIENPKKIMTNVRDVIISNRRFLVTKSDDSLWSWGNNGWLGLAGIGSAKSDEFIYTPQKIMTDVFRATCSSENSAVIKNDGSLWMWGSNWCGNLGTGNEHQDEYKPKKIIPASTGKNEADNNKRVILSKNPSNLTEKDLFMYPYCQYLDNPTLNAVFEQLLDDIDETAGITSGHSWRQYWALLKSSYMKPGEITGFIRTASGKSEALNDSANDKLAIALANKVQDNEDALSKAVGKVFKSVTKSSGEMKKIYDLIKAGLNTEEDYKKVAKMFAQLFGKENDPKAIKAYENMLKYLEQSETKKTLQIDWKKQGMTVAMDLVELEIYMVSIVEITDAVVDDLMAPLQPYNSIYQALKRLKNKIENIPDALLHYAVYDMHIGEKWVKGLVGQFEPEKVKIIIKSIHVIGLLLPAPKFDDIVVASWASEAAKQYYAALAAKRDEYLNNKNGDAAARQKEYSFLYIATTQMIDIAYDYAQRVANKAESKTLDKDYKAIKKYLSYEKYIKGCLENANRKYSYIVQNGNAVITGSKPTDLTTLGRSDGSSLQLMEAAGGIEEKWMNIPETIDGLPVVEIENGAIPAEITRVALPDSMQTIGKEAFRNCPNLIAVYGGNSLSKIVDEAFVNCNNLESISISPSVKSIGENAFVGTPESFTVVGKSDSYAKKYAEEKGLSLLDAGKNAVSVSIATMPKKISFENEQTVDFAGLSIKIVYDDGSSEILSDGITCVLPSPKVGENTVFVFGKEKSATFKIQLKSVINSIFVDVPEGTWYTNAVYYCKDNGYMAGISDAEFNPTGTVTRGTITQVLYAMEGKPKVSKSAGFKDVASGKWYADSVNWAAGIGLVAGYSKVKFGPNDPITRQQMAAIMYQYAKYKKYDTSAKGDISKFKDSGSVTKYAVTPMKWATGHEIISGTNKGLEPKGTATRAQIAVILQAFDNNIR